jgi:hypothetical protein
VLLFLTAAALLQLGTLLCAVLAAQSPNISICAPENSMKSATFLTVA